MISIIMPVYNAETTIKYSVESLLSQEVKDIELLLINDGSTDGSLKECQRFARKDRRVHVYTQENKGASAARNLGLSNAAGEYIAFCDADDYVEKDIYSILLSELENSHTELAICGYDLCDGYREEAGCKKNDAVMERSICLNKEEAFYHALTDMGCLGYLWNKLFLRSHIVADGQRNIQFNEEISILEDHTFVMEYINTITHACLLRKTLYHYVQSKGSITHQSDIGRDCSTILAREIIYRIILESHCSPGTMNLGWQFLFRTNAICYKNLFFAKSFPERKRYLGYIKDCFKRYGRKREMLSCFTSREKVYYFFMKATRRMV